MGTVGQTLGWQHISLLVQLSIPPTRWEKCCLKVECVKRQDLCGPLYSIMIPIPFLHHITFLQIQPFGGTTCWRWLFTGLYCSPSSPTWSEKTFGRCLSTTSPPSRSYASHGPATLPGVWGIPGIANDIALSRCGALVLIVHDFADAFLEAAKLFHYAKWDNMPDKNILHVTDRR